ncbi:hypothetical protein K4H00_24315, partial [Mycobacterium tuberculosis]|nr:hypothetical protein [Mycobacterium tuberculosis]
RKQRPNRISKKTASDGGFFLLISDCNQEEKMPRTDDLRVREVKELTPPSHLIRELGSTEKVETTTAQCRTALHRILHGQDDRVMV